MRGARCNSAAEGALIFAISAQIWSLRFITARPPLLVKVTAARGGVEKGGSGRTCRRTLSGLRWRGVMYSPQDTRSLFLLPATAAK